LIFFVGAERFYAMVNFFKLRMSGKEAQNFIFILISREICCEQNKIYGVPKKLLPF